jgi:predicted Ser/Thr protein kinase
LALDPGENGFPYREIDYNDLKLQPKPIGKGAFGVVFRGEWRGAQVAVKKLMMYFDEKELATFRAEAALMHAYVLCVHPPLTPDTLS